MGFERIFGFNMLIIVLFCLKLYCCSSFQCALIAWFCKLVGIVMLLFCMIFLERNCLYMVNSGFCGRLFGLYGWSSIAVVSGGCSFSGDLVCYICLILRWLLYLRQSLTVIMLKILRC